MNGRFLNRLLKLDAKHALYREDGKWYHNLKKFPGVLFDGNGYVLFENEHEYYSNSNLQVRKDLHVVDGIVSLERYKTFSNDEIALIRGVDLKVVDIISDSEETVRRVREVNMILRKKPLAEKLKKLYEHTCQLCMTRLRIGKDKFYSEVHHIIPLGNPHNGKDNTSNMICVCPNCHVLLDFKSTKLSLRDMRSVLHEISEESIDYHNSHC